MPLIAWDDSLCTGVGEIDEQHKVLFGFINQLHEAVTFGTGDGTLSTVLAGLVNYTVYHFSTEERLMQEHSYPEFARHKEEHDYLTAKVMGFFDRFQKGNGGDIKGVLAFLIEWLTDHIMETDKKCGLFLREKGVK